MKSLFAPLFSALALIFMAGGCDKSAAPAPDEKVLIQVVEDNARAFNNKDVEGVMATIHPKMANFADLKAFIAQTFKDVDLKATLSDLKVVTSSPEEARVSFKQRTEKVTSAGAVALNIVEGVHTLRPDNGKWKIFGTVNTNVTRLDQKPGETPDSAAPAAASVPETAPTAPAPAPPPSPSPATPAPEAPKPATPAEKPPQ